MILSNRIIKDSEGPSEFCLKAAKNFTKNFKNSVISSKNFIDNFGTNQNKCFELTNKLQLNILCGLCNPDFNQTINFQDRKVFIDKNGCEDISFKCRDTVSTNLSMIYPYLRHLEPLMRCSPDGDFDTNLEKLKMRSTNPINDEIQEKFSLGQCEKSLTFGTRMNYNSEGDPHFLKKLFRRARKYFDFAQLIKEEKTRSEIATFVEKRRLGVKKSKKLLDEFFETLDQKTFKKILLGSDGDEEDLISYKKWFKNFVSAIREKEDGGFKFSAWIEYKIQDQKYPKLESRYNEFVSLCKSELNGYFERNYVLLLLAEEKNKLVKNFKDITYQKFKDSYKCSRFVGQFIATIESLQNEHLRYPDQ